MLLRMKFCSLTLLYLCVLSSFGFVVHVQASLDDTSEDDNDDYFLPTNAAVEELIPDARDANAQHLCPPPQSSSSEAPKQCFETVPLVKYEALLGSRVTIPCKVRHLAGRVQWRLKDTMMGYDPPASTFPRFELSGNRANGDFQLDIHNVSDQDQGEYECQVSPKKNNPLLRVSTQLIILKKPQKPHFLRHADGQPLQVNPKSTRTSIICASENGNPPAIFTWHLNGRELHSNESLSIQSKNGRSQLSVHTQLLNTNDILSCIVTNAAMQREDDIRAHTYRTNIELQVSKEPGDPVIRGFKTTWRYRLGDRLNVTCWATAGIPEGSLVWKRLRRNGVEESMPFHYEKKKHRLMNQMSLILTELDHNAYFKCIAQNRVTKIPKETRIHVEVEYPPASAHVIVKNVELSNTKNLTLEDKDGSNKVLECISAVYFREITIVWFEDDKLIGERFYKQHVIGKGADGYVKVNELRVYFNNLTNGRLYKCVVTGVTDLKHVVVVKLRVNFPPPKPTIRMRPEDGRFVLDKNITLRCEASEGSPLSSLVWYKDKQQLLDDTIIEKHKANMVMSSLTIKPQISDNGVKIICVAVNKAYLEGVESSALTLNVLFPPQNINLTVLSVLPAVANSSILFRCVVDTANPPAIITWILTPCDFNQLSTAVSFSYMKQCHQRDNQNSRAIQEFNHTSVNLKTGSTGFTFMESISYLKIDASEQLDLSSVVCRATNQPFADRHSLTDERIIRITYPPRLSNGKKVLNLAAVNEGENFRALIGLLANPQVESLKLMHGERGQIIPQNHPRLQLDSEQGVLYLNQVKVTDMGKYELSASNSLGVSQITLFINVTYPANIRFANVITNAPSIWPDTSKQVTLKCQATGNPLPYDIRWVRIMDNMHIACGQTVQDSSGEEKLMSVCQTGENGAKLQITNKLVILRASRMDMTRYFCEANNGIGKPMRSGFVHVRVDLKPELHMEMSQYRSATQINRPAVLQCRVRAWPEPKFAWFALQEVDGLERRLRSNAKYKMSTIRAINDTLLGIFQQDLIINWIQESDYIIYRCRVHNEHGSAFANINLTATSQPDQPRDLRAANATATSIDVSWLAGHDGGYPQIFNVKYQFIGQSHAKYEDVGFNSNNNAVVSTRLEHLIPGQVYLIRVNSRNAQHGASKYTESVKISTLLYYAVASNHKPGKSESSSLLVIVGSCITGLFVLLLNFVCLALFLRRRQINQCWLRSQTTTLTQHRNEILYSDTIDKDLSAIQLYPRHQNGYCNPMPDKMSCHQHTLKSMDSDNKSSFYSGSGLNDDSAHGYAGHVLYNTFNESFNSVTANGGFDKQYSLPNQNEIKLSRIRPDVALSCSTRNYAQIVPNSALSIEPLMTPNKSNISSASASLARSNTTSASRGDSRLVAETNFFENQDFPADYLDAVRQMNAIRDHNVQLTNHIVHQSEYLAALATVLAVPPFVNNGWDDRVEHYNCNDGGNAGLPSARCFLQQESSASSTLTNQEDASRKIAAPNNLHRLEHSTSKESSTRNFSLPEQTFTTVKPSNTNVKIGKQLHHNNSELDPSHSTNLTHSSSTMTSFCYHAPTLPCDVRSTSSSTVCSQNEDFSSASLDNITVPPPRAFSPIANMQNLVEQEVIYAKVNRKIQVMPPVDSEDDMI